MRMITKITVLITLSHRCGEGEVDQVFFCVSLCLSWVFFFSTASIPVSVSSTIILYQAEVNLFPPQAQTLCDGPGRFGEILSCEGFTRRGLQRGILAFILFLFIVFAVFSVFFIFLALIGPDQCSPLEKHGW